MSTYLHGRGSRQTPQSQPIPGSDQVPNRAGGYSFTVDKWGRLERFLVLGSAAGTYYIGQGELTGENVDAVRQCLAEDGKRTVDIIVAVSTEGRAVKPMPAIFALALACSDDRDEVKRYALDNLPEVCRTGTHLFQFASIIEEHRGWGRSLRRAIGRWYLSRDVDQIAYQAVKYRQREGVTHADLLRLSHPGERVSSGNPELPVTEAQDRLFKWIVDRDSDDGAPVPDIAQVIAFEEAQKAETPKDTVGLIEQYGRALPHEALNTDHKNDPGVNLALLRAGMPMTALIRNLANLTRYGVVAPGSEGTQIVLEQLSSDEHIRKARVHPYTVLQAMLTYQRGFGRRNEWEPVTQVVDALDAAFYKAFANVEPSGKRLRLALDVSGSMTHPVIESKEGYDYDPYGRGASAVSCRAAAAAMALVTAATEPNYNIVAFAAGRRGYGFGRTPSNLEPCDISPRQRLDDVIAKTDSYGFCGTDCALPMVDALEKGLLFDAFVVYTDSETWFGNIHPTQALQKYREQTGIDAKLVVVGMASNGFTIADPNDAGMLDVVGFDTAAPNVIADFVR